MRYALPDGTRLGALQGCGQDWQLYRVDRHNRVFVATAALAERWVSCGLLSESAFIPFGFESVSYAAIHSGPDQTLAPVDAFTSPDTKADALAFSVSLRETRLIAPDVPLQDAIYLERLSRLLPTWTVSETLDDGILLGRWLTGGVAVSATSFRRLASLLGWLPKADVKDVVEAGGLAVSDDSGGFTAGALVGVRTRRAADAQARVDRRDSDPDGESTAASANAARVFRLPGRPHLEAFFNEHVIDIVAHAERYQALGIHFPTAIVLHGPPGCGKTFAVERLVEFLDWPLFNIDSSTVASPYIHETSRKVSEVFDQAMDASPAVIVIDEMESYLSDRQLHAATGLHHVEEVAEFLRRIPEATDRQVLVIGMTNRLEMIDPAILRRGRFDHVIEVGMPSQEEVHSLLLALLAKIPVAPAFAVTGAVEALTGRPLSDAAFAVREAARLAARSGNHALDQASMDAAIARLPPAEQDGSTRPIGFVWEPN
ncbi:ATP-binding protein [Thiocapsa sp. UBA6158]|jgi:hypothetical protein|uniref:ATP-binding protein n=1 Tax=Thiocapsa sp. UBA6158 TaxID=1947692 RepID=UPI0025D8DA32|nr:ATP-binding protein [Thiocapsa sp. UBA6158]